LRREGRRKRKAGAKNEKAIIIIAVFPKRSTKNPSKVISKSPFFDDNILSKKVLDNIDLYPSKQGLGYSGMVVYYYQY
jgi:hypothetical protein